MHLYLIRHGQSYLNLPEWSAGNQDTQLTDLGRDQAAALAAWLVSAIPSVDSIITSSMARARETAEILASRYRRPVRPEDQLREVGNLRRDHTAWPQDNLPSPITQYWRSERPYDSVTPSVEGGESWMHFRIRIGEYVEELAREQMGKTVLLVIHGGVVEAIFDHVFNVGPFRRCTVWDHHAAVSLLEYVGEANREKWRLHFHNWHHFHSPLGHPAPR